MNEKQQTAVQWLMEQLSYHNPEAHAELIVKGDYTNAIKLEVQHINAAYEAGYNAANADYYIATHGLGFDKQED